VALACTRPSVSQAKGLDHRVDKPWHPFGRHSFSKLTETFLHSASLVFQVGPVRRVGRRGQERVASHKLLVTRTACVHHRRRQAYRRDLIQERGQATDHQTDHQEGHQDQERGHQAFSKVLGHHSRLKRDGLHLRRGRRDRVSA
jgi:hypothetical protein